MGSAFTSLLDRISLSSHSLDLSLCNPRELTIGDVLKLRVSPPPPDLYPLALPILLPLDLIPTTLTLTNRLPLQPQLLLLLNPGEDRNEGIILLCRRTERSTHLVRPGEAAMEVSGVRGREGKDALLSVVDGEVDVVEGLRRGLATVERRRKERTHMVRRTVNVVLERRVADHVRVVDLRVR